MSKTQAHINKTLRRVRSPALSKELTELWCRHMVLAKELGLLLPKHHLMLHLTVRSLRHGSPWRHTTFVDEAINKDLKRVLRLCHQATFEQMAFVKVEAHLRARAARSSWW